MEAFCEMILHGDLPPVGNKISLQKSSENILDELLPYNKYWVDSGTSALALALLDAKASFPQVSQPRAIIPGYCCPDLIAACIYAGIEPVAIDIEFNDPSYNQDELRIHLDDRVVAIIAINFLGISDRLMQLQEIIVSMGLRTRLIEDNAQWLPSSVDEIGFASDYVTFSFGRGKPLSLLGGGVLLAKNALVDDVLQHIKVPASPSAALKVKIRAYNLLLIPFMYRFLNRNPFVRLGKTKYIALAKIEQLDIFRFALLTANFNFYSKRKADLKSQYDDAFDHIQQLVPLKSLRVKRLLRYPLLCKDEGIRNALLETMSSNGLGTTSMYGAAIDRVEGVDGLVTIPSELKNARSFARRFMTFPINADIPKVFQDQIFMLING